MFRALLVASFTTLVAAQVPSEYAGDGSCPLAGPAFPAPSRLSDSDVFSTAIDKFEAQLKNRTLRLQPNDTAWSVAIFSSKENETLYEKYWTPSVKVGVSTVGKDSVFRLGSVSKVFTVWTFLKALGDQRFNDPITKYIPELAEFDANNTAIYDDIDSVRWDEVTLGELASQSAGIARDVGLNDLSANYPFEDMKRHGFPKLDKMEIPVCGANAKQPPCTRKQFLQLLLEKTPVWPTSHSPAYSNIAFELLGYALESATGKDLETTMRESIFDKLEMKHSSFKDPPNEGGVIPGDPLQTAWSPNIGVDNAGGGLYMSTGDMIKAGQAILQSSILAPALTRRWLQPRIQTGYLGAAVGAPWEITYLKANNSRLVPYYNKDGDLGSYHSSIVLSPEHGIGLIVLVAGAPDSDAETVRTLLKNLLGTVVMPAVEEEARLEAKTRFDGRYADESTNSSLTLEAGFDGSTGLAVRSLVTHGVPAIGPGSSPEGYWASGLGIGNGTRLYPTTLKTVNRTSGDELYVSRLGFRLASNPPLVGGQLQDPCILNWASLDSRTYGKMGLDDWVIDMAEDGHAAAVNIRALKLRLKEVAES